MINASAKANMYCRVLIIIYHVYISYEGCLRIFKDILFKLRMLSIQPMQSRGSHKTFQRRLFNVTQQNVASFQKVRLKLFIDKPVFLHDARLKISMTT